MGNQFRVWKCLAGLVFTACATAVFADNQWSGDVTSGFQANLQPTDQAKFNEYLASPDGAVMNGRLDYEGEDGILGLDFSDGGGFNRKASLDMQYQNDLTVDVNFQQYQHLYTNTGETIWSNPSPNLYLLPQSLLLENQGQSSQQEYQNLLNYQNTNGQPVSMGLHDTVLGGTAKYQVSPEFDIEVGGNQKWRTGSRPIAFYSAVELPQELNETTTQSDVKAEYDGKGFALRASYEISDYENSLPSIIWSNPAQANSIPGTSSIEQASLAPSNLANTFKISGLLDINNETRANADFSLGYETQDQPFLPYTANTADPLPAAGMPPGATSLANTNSLAYQSLNGCIQILTQNYVLTSRPTKDLVVSLRYKDYEQADMTALLDFPGYVDKDASWAVNTGNVVNNNFGWVNQDLGGKATYTLMRGLQLNAGYDCNWENYQDREISATTEQTAKGGLDLKPLHGLDVSGDYTYSDRVASQSNWTNDLEIQPNAGTVNAPFDYGDALSSTFRRYDIADRVVNEFTTKVKLDVTKNLWLSAAWTTGGDNYQPGSEALTGDVYTTSLGAPATILNSNTQLGLLSDYHDITTFSAVWQPLDNLNLSGTVNWENYNYNQANGPSNISPSNPLNPGEVWYLNEQENTTYLSFAGNYQMNSKVDLDARWTLTNNTGDYIFSGYNNQFPLTAAGVPVSQVIQQGGAPVTVAVYQPTQSLPNTMYWKEDFNFGVTYHISETWSLRGSYLLEVYNVNDWQTDGVGSISSVPATGALNYMFLGGWDAPYTAQMASLTLTAKL